MNMMLADIRGIIADPELLLQEKWLFAPALRVGQQWLDALTLAGAAPINVRIKTLAGLANELAAPEIAARRWTPLNTVGMEMLFEQLWDRISRREQSGYLSSLRPGRELIEALQRTIQALRLAGIAPKQLRAPAFEVQDKGRQLRRLMEEYLKELQERNLTDYAGVLELATQRLARDPQALPGGVIALAPEDLDCAPLERRLLEALGGALGPDGMRRLRVDRPCSSIPDDEPPSDALLLRWTPKPQEAPAPRADGAASIIQAQGEINEVRSALRRCLSGAIPLDDVELLYTDEATYLPLIYETMERFAFESNPEDKGLPATFAQGIPARYSRPGRALTAWMQWIAQGYPQAGAVRMIREGLLDIADATKAGLTFHELATSLRSLGIGLGRERYIKKIEERISSESPSRSLECFKVLKSFFQSLLEATPAKGAQSPARDLLESARAFLNGFARGANEYDNYARQRLVQAVDPLLLDAERQRLSKELETSQSALEHKHELLMRLLARLRGKVFLSFSNLDVRTNEERFPSSILVNAYRILSGNREGGQKELLEWLAPPAAFAPAVPEACLSQDEWWLWRLCERTAPADGALEAVGRRYPHLAEGMNAAARRLTDQFTAYDGRVPEAGRANNPLELEGPSVSSSRLEKTGQCPLAYFFRYILELPAPPEEELDRWQWLDPPQAGELMHEVLCAFMRERMDADELPVSAESDAPRLKRLLDESLDRMREMAPPPTKIAYLRREQDLARMTRVFLAEEERYERETGARPVYLEASIGIKPQAQTTPLDCVQPMQLDLPERASILVKGRIDRIDRAGGNGRGNAGAEAEEFEIWDYKSGSSFRFRKEPPFARGRIIQNALYIAMGQERLRQAPSPRARVAKFGYFFLGARESGERLAWAPEELEEGASIILSLCQIAGAGTFLATNDMDDCKYCEFQPICGDLAAVTAASQRKMENESNAGLEVYRQLRLGG
ncbi:MAG: PD-(D/E)XK nuclease family protein [Candidatus Sumerlaeota bacterium]|nr:PD-(D/E)XK nuclease family protein [Candidatus Sumerlaeota bacterium]